MDMGNSEVLEAVSQFMEQLKCSGLPVEAVYLCGSYATGTVHRDSETDVAIISGDFTGNWLEDHRKVAAARLNSDVRIGPDRSAQSSSVTRTLWSGRSSKRGSG